MRLEVSDLNQVQQTGGVDIALYRVNDPLRFLAAQSDLHRIQLLNNALQPSVADLLGQSWNLWASRTRRLLRHLFSTPARQTAVLHQAAFASKNLMQTPPAPQSHLLAPLPGYTRIALFRYPLQFAQPIHAPAGVQLQGSSSNFLPESEGNVYVPLGHLRPGLYIVEASVGTDRATTALFISNTIAVNKISSQQQLLWTVDRQEGRPVAATHNVWTDGSGLLASGDSDTRGLLQLNHSAPERSYVYGTDPQGGVYISENFYYDSEIYNTKLFATTDRPLYHPGDTVYFRVWARTFSSARLSQRLMPGKMTLEVFDPNGLPVAHQQLSLSQEGGTSSFTLPSQSVAGGYEMRMHWDSALYGASFRVGDYQKPHFSMDLHLDKPHLKTLDPVNGVLNLHYPDGRPVAYAHLQLLLRSQKTTMVQGDLQYMGQFPLKLQASELTTDAQGQAPLHLPAAVDPSRYLLTVLATDAAAFRVKGSYEILIERAASVWHLQADQKFSAPGDRITFTFQTPDPLASPPVHWSLLRLEDQHRLTGTLSSAEQSSQRFSIAFSQAGSYTLSLSDAQDNLVAACSHWVSGEGLQVAPGTIEVVMDHETYHPGDTANALLSFSEPVSHALLTLEQDQVEHTALLGETGDWLEAHRLNDRQWSLRIPVRSEFSPNITLSIAYVRQNQFVFQNQGLRISQPSIHLKIVSNQHSYRPHDLVHLDIYTDIQQKPVAATLSLAIVDEIIYALQPELAPNIQSFFYHLRHSNVRTSASFTFTGYDVSRQLQGHSPDASQSHQRIFKVLERPRRDDIDTLYWNGDLHTGTDGHLHLDLPMPDALGHWRITARAMSAEGIVGQHTAWIDSSQPLYLKWSSPHWFRQGDQPQATLAVFNDSQATQTLQLQAKGGLNTLQTLSLSPGVSYVPVSLVSLQNRPVDFYLWSQGKLQDSLRVPLRKQPAFWESLTQQWLTLSAQTQSITLPSDAQHIQMTLATGPLSLFARLMDQLIQQPTGSVVRTASQMIPLGMAYKVAQATTPTQADQIAHQLYDNHLRLSHMAGPQGQFGWWGPWMPVDPFITGWAYYADWLSMQAVGSPLPDGAIAPLQDLYSQTAPQLPAWQRALMVDWMRQMHLPVTTLTQGLLQTTPPLTSVIPCTPTHWYSLLDSTPTDSMPELMGWVMTGFLAQQQHIHPTLPQQKQISTARFWLDQCQDPRAKALLIYTQLNTPSQAAALLPLIRGEYPSMDQALLLAWLASSSALLASPQSTPQPLAPWQWVQAQSGERLFLWPQTQTPPQQIALTQRPARPLTAILRYHTRTALPSADLGLHFIRRLYQLHLQKDGSFLKTAVPAPARLMTGALYLDELQVNRSAAPLKHVLAVLALPPGGTLETGTWGVRLRDAGSATAADLEAAQGQACPGGYTIPMDSVSGHKIYRHLLRFGEKGRFQLPPAYLYDVYRPNQRQYENPEAALNALVVQ